MKRRGCFEVDFNVIESWFWRGSSRVLLTSFAAQALPFDCSGALSL